MRICVMNNYLILQNYVVVVDGVVVVLLYRNPKTKSVNKSH